MGQINIGTPIDTSLIQCCRCHKGYEIKDNIYENNILVCPHCGLKHKLDFKLFGNRIDNLKKVDRLNLGVIDIGSPAINRDAYVNLGYTYILKENPANADGKITDIEIYTRGALSGCIVATFYVISGSILSARDSHYIGNVPAWSHQTISDLNIDVKAGDYIGLYFSGGAVEGDDSGYAGYWDAPGDKTSTPDYAYGFNRGTISLYGTGTTEVADFEYVGTGTFTYSGTAIIIIGFTCVGSGELTYSGTATQIYTRDYLTTASGQLAYSGTAGH
ncbi:hypothetical protein ES695_00110, partial [Candidatus Atribacteria bacterium 1244-E10-H5-B2]